MLYFLILFNSILSHSINNYYLSPRVLEGASLKVGPIPCPKPSKKGKSNVYWTVHHCNSRGIRNQLDVTCFVYYT